MEPPSREDRRPRSQPGGNGGGIPPTPQQQPQAAGPPGAGKARLQCHACHRLLEYDAGAQYVQCFSCSTMNAVQARTPVGGRVLSMLCAICHTTNLAPYGTAYVRCGTCATVSQVSHAYPNQQQDSRGMSGQPQHQRPQQPAVPDAAMMQQLQGQQMQALPASVPQVPALQPGGNQQQQTASREGSQHSGDFVQQPGQQGNNFSRSPEGAEGTSGMGLQ